MVIKMEKFFRSIALFLIVPFVLSGCNSLPSNTENQGTDIQTETALPADANENTSAVASEEQITLTFSYWGDKNELACKEELIKDFEAAHPNIKIEATYTDGVTYHTKLQTFFTSQTAPDVISIAGDIMYDFVEEGVFEDLTPYIERDRASEKWVDGSLNIFTKNGKIYAAPYVSKVFAMAYNKDIFDAAGLAYPTESWTEEDFVNIAWQLTEGEGVNKIYGTKLTDGAKMIRDLYGQMPLYDVDNKKMQAEGNEYFRHAFSLYTDLVIGGCSPSELETDSIGGGFETGKFATAICATWDMNSWEKLIGDSFEWDIVQLPSNTVYGSWTYPSYTDGMAISSTSEHKEAAWEFIKWNTLSEESQKKVSEIGVPVLKSYVESESYLNDFPDSYAVKYNKKAFVDMMDRVAGQESLGIWAKINDELTKQYNAVSLSQTTIDDAIAVLQEKGESVLK